MLATLNLSSNSIQVLPGDLLIGLNGLTEVRLDDNFISDDGLADPLYTVAVRASHTEDQGCVCCAVGLVHCCRGPPRALSVLPSGRVFGLEWNGGGGYHPAHACVGVRV